VDSAAGADQLMRYYPVVRNWGRKIRPHLSDPEVIEVLVRDFNKFTFGHWGRPFLAGMKPRDFESCDWPCDRRGRHPEYWAYVKHAACHWLVNHGLKLAERAEPKIPWRIVTSRAHSTVWSGEDLLFDFNFLALEVDPNEAWALARTKGRVLPIGKDYTCHFVGHFEDERRAQQKLWAAPG
jgi:hypothetical protein